MDSRIFLIGFMGSGKSTHGSKLAGMIGYRYVDMDRLIEQTAGMSIPAIFREHGEAVFRKWEHDILMELCFRQEVVVSTGGGAPCHGEMIRIMNKHGCTIYIQLSPRALKDRLFHSKTERPLIKGKSEEELLTYIEQLLEVRESYYQQARHTVDGEGLQTERLVELVRTCP
ncbi:MAG: shikimate kinase [Bacteroidales bacterium]